ncbi:hypothetical protein H5V45_06390 [Nocardioides sp. KIGAM211]|uniref:Uncharacterized protein n=1 Tax=Nocardioides luti TaxID=2761101 RepID=A0A7X0RES3_9ACTN|nr:hypothetical protein [Nocardioides luti]MBB6626946.1 hypothetical protein [Nocardioides luti]
MRSALPITVAAALAASPLLAACADDDPDPALSSVVSLYTRSVGPLAAAVVSYREAEGVLPQQVEQQDGDLVASNFGYDAGSEPRVPAGEADLAWFHSDGSTYDFCLTTSRGGVRTHYLVRGAGSGDYAQTKELERGACPAAPSE